MKNFFLSLFVFCSLLLTSIEVAHAQLLQNIRINMANKSYNDMLYGEAIPLFEEILHSDPKNVEIKRKLANSYRITNDTRNAERVYSELVKEDSVALLNKLYYAQTLAENGKYDLSRVWYKKYDDAISIDSRGKRFFNTYKDMNRFYKDSSKWVVELLNINSAQSDFTPKYYKGGLVFCSSRFPGGSVKNVFGFDHSAFIDLYYVADTSLIKGQKYYTPIAKEEVDTYYDSTGHMKKHSEDSKNSGNDSHTLGYYGEAFNRKEEPFFTDDKHIVMPFNKQINSKFHEGPFSFSNNQDSIVLTRNGNNKGKLIKSKDGTNKLKIYSAKQLPDGKWEKGAYMKFNKFQYYVKFTSLNKNRGSSTESDTAYLKEITLDDDQFSISHPCLSADNTKMFFVSDAPIGFGGTDLYVSDLVDGVWSSPINCGKNINTEGNEMFPFLDENGNLYFSSDGWGGLGGLDFYYSETEMNIFGKKDNIFRRAVNLGYPINSKKDDFGILTDGKMTSGFISSNRRKGINDDDIFRFRYVGATTIYSEGIVLRKNSQKTLDSVKVVLKDLTNKKDSIITKTNGKYAFNNLLPGSEYFVLVERRGYVPEIVPLNTLSLKRGDTVRVNVELQPKELFIYVRGNVYGEDDKKPLASTKIRIYNNCTGVTDEVVTDMDGNYVFRLKENCCYAISAIKDNCGVNSTVVSTMGLQDNTIIPANFSMLCKGDVVKIDDINYDLGKWDIRPDAAAKLDILYGMLEKYPDMSIEVRAHTDSRGDDTKNLTLSDNRAKSVEKYLEGKGINVKRISGKGYGEKILLNTCGNGSVCSEEEHAVNRRTEFKILSMGKPMAQSTINDKAKNCAENVQDVIKKEEENNRDRTAIVEKTLESLGITQPLIEEKKINPLPPVEVKKEEPKVTPVTPPVVKKEEPVVVKKEEPKKEEPKVTPVTPPVVKKEESVVVKKEELKKEEPKVTPVTPPVVKKEEPVVVKKEEPKKEEPKVTPVTPPVVKKEEPVVVKKEEPKKEEPKVTPVTPPVVKKEEPVVVKKEEPKKEEPKVTPVTPPVAKKEEPVVVKKEEPKVTPVTPPVVKKEEPKKEEPKVTPVTPPVVKKEESKKEEPKKEINLKSSEDDLFGDILGTESGQTVTLKGNVYKSGSTETINGTKLIVKHKGKAIDSLVTAINGGFTFSRLEAGKDYELFAVKKGYFEQKIAVSAAVLKAGQVGNFKVQMDKDPNFTDFADDEVKLILKGKVTNSKTKAIMAGVTVQITNNMDKSVQEVKTGADGFYTFRMKKQSHYTLKVITQGCESIPQNKSTIGITYSQEINGDIAVNCN